MQSELIHLVRPATNSGAPAPLLVLLHGYGSDEYDLFDLGRYLDLRFCIVSVRAPHAFPPGYGWYPVEFGPEGVTADETTVPAERDRLLRFLDQAAATYGADPDRTVLMGFSQGAAIALYTALTHPERVAATVAMSGRLVPQARVDRASDAALTGKPFLVTHGLHDRVLPIAQGRAIRDFLERYPLRSRYREFPMAHEVSGESLEEILSWLKDWLDQ